jgi:hypothetical protein
VNMLVIIGNKYSELACERGTHSLNNNASNLVRISVAGWSSILEIALAILGDLTGDTDASTTVSYTVGKLINGAGFMTTSKTLFIALAIHGNVLKVTSLQLFHRSLNVFDATIGTHLSGGNVGVETGTIPVTRDGLGREGDLGPELFSNAVKEETRHPELVTHCVTVNFRNIQQISHTSLTPNTLARADLILPLSRHDLGVDTRDLDASVQASLEMGLDNVTAEHLAGTDTTIVGTLSTRETPVWPAIWPAGRAKECVLLLETEPEVLRGVVLHEFGSLMAVVELVRAAIRVPRLAKDKNVFTPAEWVREERDRADVDVRVVTRGLAGGRPVKVPLWELVDGLDSLRKGL